MNEVLHNIQTAIYATTLWEWLGVLSGVLYVVFISFKHIAAWYFALVSSCIYVYLCFISQLYLETGLQFFYVAMAIYGWLQWKKQTTTDEQLIIKWELKKHLINIVISSSLVLITGYLFDNYTKQANPYTDAFSTIFSLAATYMVTKKVLENWIYWIVIDAVCIYLFASRHLYMSSLLFFIYTIIAILGYFKWRSLFNQQLK